MWRETDSWFELLFSDGSKGYAHISADGDYIGIYHEDGTEIGDEPIEYTCVNDNASSPKWYKA